MSLKKTSLLVFLVNHTLFFLNGQFRVCIIFFLGSLVCNSAFDTYQEFMTRDAGVEKKQEKARSNKFSIAVGKFDIQRQSSNYIDLSYKFEQATLYQLIPSLGVLVTDLGASYCYGSVHLLWPFGVSRLALSPSFNCGVYQKGKGKDLGFPIEFRSGLTLVFRGVDIEAGLCLSHISNAHLGKKNPGLESIGLFLQF